MKKLYFFIFLFISLSVNCESQNYKWVRKEGGWYKEDCRNSTTDVFGNTFVILTNYENIIIEGTLYTWCEFPGSILIKYSPQGKLLWARKFCVKATFGIETDFFGNCMVSGGASPGNSIENGKGGSDTILIQNTLDAFIAKFSPDGKLLWETTYNPTTDNATSGELAIDNTGNIYLIVGAFSRYSSRSFIVKVSPQGKIIWDIPANPKYGDMNQICTDSHNNLYVQGSTSASFLFSNILIDPNNITEHFIVKFNSAGNIVWIKEESGYIEGSDMNVTKNGSIIISGNAGSFGGQIGGIPIKRSESFVAKFDSLGNNKWVKKSSLNYPKSSVLNESIVFGGSLKDSISFYLDSLKFFPKGNGFFIIQLDSSGKALSTFQNAANKKGWAYLEKINTFKNGDISIAGVFWDSLYMGQNLLFCNDSGSNKGDVFIARLMNFGNSVGIFKKQILLENDIYPNPSLGLFSIRRNNISEIIKIRVHDLLGHCILEKEIQNEISPAFDLRNCPKGIYFLEIISSNYIQTEKIIKQ